MGFQKQVYGTLNEGVAGSRASQNPASFSAKKAIGSPQPGRFVWGSADGTQYSPAGAGVPDGFATLTHTGVIIGYMAEAQMVYPDGFNVEATHSGDWWARSTTTATLKQKVFASNTTGEIATGAAGATIAGFTETPWVVTAVAAPGTAGSAITISKN